MNAILYVVIKKVRNTLECCELVIKKMSIKNRSYNTMILITQGEMKIEAKLMQVICFVLRLNNFTKNLLGRVILLFT